MLITKQKNGNSDQSGLGKFNLINLRIIYTFHEITFTVLISLHQLVKPLSDHAGHLYRMAYDKSAAITCDNRIQYYEKYNKPTISF